MVTGRSRALVTGEERTGTERRLEEGEEGKEQEREQDQEVASPPAPGLAVASLRRGRSYHCPSGAHTAL